MTPKTPNKKERFLLWLARLLLGGIARIERHIPLEGKTQTKEGNWLTCCFPGHFSIVTYTKSLCNVCGKFEVIVQPRFFTNALDGDIITLEHEVNIEVKKEQS